MSNRVAKLTIDNQTVELPIQKGTLGASVIEINKIRTLDEEIYTFDPGFTVTGSCESKITFIDGKNGILLHRGYPIEQLAEKRNYMDVCHLLLKGELPSQEERTQFEFEIKDKMLMHQQICSFFNGFRRDAHPMAIMVGVVGALSAFYHDDLNIKDPEHREMAAIRLIGKMPTIAAMCHRYATGLPFVAPQKNLGYAENFLYMMFKNPSEPYEVNPILAKAMDKIFILHADHEQNASTSTVRLAGSTGANPFACISAGIGALWGPAHGGANEACLNMLKEIGDESRIHEYIERAKNPDDPFRLMGFGHRVYKNHDPRAKIMKETCHEVLQATNSSDIPVFKLAMKLEKIALEDEYFVEKNLYPNVDFYSGLTLSALGIPSNMFTVIFALARTSGWISQWHEMITDGYKLGRPRQLYMGETQRDVE